MTTKIKPMNTIDQYLAAVRANIRYHRVKNGLSVRELTELLGLKSKGQVSAIEHMDKALSLRTVLNIAAVLEIDPTELLQANIVLKSSDARSTPKSVRKRSISAKPTTRKLR